MKIRLQTLRLQTTLPVLAVGALALVATAPHAQTAGQKIGFVDVQSAVQADAAFPAADAIQKQGQADLKPLTDQITAIQQKGASATAQDRQNYDTLTKTYDSKAKTWNDQYQAKLKPVLTDVDAAVAAVAKAQGFSIVMDRAVAAQSSLVIYADNTSTDLTSAVVAQIKKK